MKVLIVEDEEAILEGTREFLTESGYDVYIARNGEEALRVFNENNIEIIILDIMLPEKSGIEVLEEIRKTSLVPIIMVTALTDDSMQIKTFDLLVDDYLSKPFSLIILQKRLEALYRRFYGEQERWIYKDAIVNFTSYQSEYEGVDAKLKPKEIEILKLLLKNKNKVMSRNQILDNVWKYEEEPYDRTIDVYIKNIRKKLNLDCIETVKNVGYKLKL